MSDDDRIRQIAYSKWQEAGCPEGKSDEFWQIATQSLKLYKLYDNRYNEEETDDYDEYEGPIDEKEDEAATIMPPWGSNLYVPPQRIESYIPPPSGRGLVGVSPPQIVIEPYAPSHLYVPSPSYGFVSGRYR